MSKVNYHARYCTKKIRTKYYEFGKIMQDGVEVETVKISYFKPFKKLSGLFNITSEKNGKEVQEFFHLDKFLKKDVEEDGTCYQLYTLKEHYWFDPDTNETIYNALNFDGPICINQGGDLN